MHELVTLLAETVAALDAAEADAAVSKADVVDMARKRLCVMMGQVVAYPVVTNFALPCVEASFGADDGGAEFLSYFTA
jgi:hypothetical protein